MTASGLLIGLFALAAFQDAPPADALIANLASERQTSGGIYPAQAVWDRFVEFCKNAQAVSSGWDEYQPQPNTPLYHFAEGASPFGGVPKKPPVTVYRTTISGQPIFAMKRVVDVNLPARLYCSAYDFSMTERLNTDSWKSAVGSFSKVEETEFTQRFSYETAPAQDRNFFGNISLNQPGYFPPLDAIGFTGLQLIAISKDSE
jgi:hypothetical protein